MQFLVPVTSYTRPEKKSKFGEIQIGYTFGFLKVVSKKPMYFMEIGYECICKCGKKTYARKTSLHRGDKKSCGCYARKFEWSKNYENCTQCQKKDSDYASKGICKRCYAANRSKIKKEAKCKTIPQSNLIKLRRL